MFGRSLSRTVFLLQSFMFVIIFIRVNAGRVHHSLLLRRLFRLRNAGDISRLPPFAVHNYLTCFSFSIFPPRFLIQLVEMRSPTFLVSFCVFVPWPHRGKHDKCTNSQFFVSSFSRAAEQKFLPVLQTKILQFSEKKEDNFLQNFPQRNFFPGSKTVFSFPCYAFSSTTWFCAAAST